MNNPAEIYRRGAIESAPPSMLVLMLYRGAIRFSREAAEAIERKDISTAHTQLIRAQSIILALQSALREMGPVTQSLDAVYDYLLRRLVEANVAKDRVAVIEVASLLESLRDGWKDVLHESTASRMAAMRQGGRLRLDSQE